MFQVNRFKKFLAASLAVACFILLQQRAFAAELVNTIVTTTDANPITIIGAGKDVRRTTQDINNAVGQFAPLANRPFNVIYSVGHATNVLQLTSNAAGTVVSLIDPNSGNREIITGNTREEVQTKVQSFLETTLNRVFVGYQTNLNANSSIGVTDGNPLAATAVISTDAFTQFGINPTVPQASMMTMGRFQLGIQGGGGAYSGPDSSGNYGNIDVSAAYRIADPIALALSIPIEYRSVGGTNTYVGGLTFGAPVTLLHHSVNYDGFSWQLTPWVNVGGGINSPLLSGGGIYGGGGTSSFAYQTGNLTLTLADQVGYLAGFPFTYDEVKYDTPVSQWVLINGVQADYRFAGPCFLDGGVSYTNFLLPAFIHQYLTARLGVGVSWGAFNSSSLLFTYVGNYGNQHYVDNGLQILLRMRF